MSMKALIETALEADTIDEAVLPIQEMMGVTDGGKASLYFSHVEHWTPLSREDRRTLLMGYVQDELTA